MRRQRRPYTYLQSLSRTSGMDFFINRSLRSWPSPPPRRPTPLERWARRLLPLRHGERAYQAGQAHPPVSINMDVSPPLLRRPAGLVNMDDLLLARLCIQRWPSSCEASSPWGVPRRRRREVPSLKARPWRGRHSLPEPSRWNFFSHPLAVRKILG